MIGNDGDNEGWFLLLEEGVFSQHSADLDAKTILLQSLGLVEDEEGLRYRKKGVWVLVSVLHL